MAVPGSKDSEISLTPADLERLGAYSEQFVSNLKTLNEAGRRSYLDIVRRGPLPSDTFIEFVSGLSVGKPEAIDLWNSYYSHSPTSKAEETVNAFRLHMAEKNIHIQTMDEFLKTLVTLGHINLNNQGFTGQGLASNCARLQFTAIARTMGLDVLAGPTDLMSTYHRDSRSVSSWSLTLAGEKAPIVESVLTHANRLAKSDSEAPVRFSDFEDLIKRFEVEFKDSQVGDQFAISFIRGTGSPHYTTFVIAGFNRVGKPLLEVQEVQPTTPEGAAEAAEHYLAPDRYIRGGVVQRVPSPSNFDEKSIEEVRAAIEVHGYESGVSRWQTMTLGSFQTLEGKVIPNVLDTMLQDQSSFTWHTIGFELDEIGEIQVELPHRQPVSALQHSQLKEELTRRAKVIIEADSECSKFDLKKHLERQILEEFRAEFLEERRKIASLTKQLVGEGFLVDSQIEMLCLLRDIEPEVFDQAFDAVAMVHLGELPVNHPAYDEFHGMDTWLTRDGDGNIRQQESPKLDYPMLPGRPKMATMFSPNIVFKAMTAIRPDLSIEEVENRAKLKHHYVSQNITAREPSLMLAHGGQRMQLRAKFPIAHAVVSEQFGRNDFRHQIENRNFPLIVKPGRDVVSDVKAEAAQKAEYLLRVFGDRFGMADSHMLYDDLKAEFEKYIEDDTRVPVEVVEQVELPQYRVVKPLGPVRSSDTKVARSCPISGPPQLRCEYYQARPNRLNN